MEIKSFPNNRDEYIGAEEAMRWLHGRTSGVFGAADNAAVSAAGGMTVSVSDGTGWITNADGNGIVWWNGTQKETGTAIKLELSPSDSLLNRIDRIIVEWKTTGYADLPTVQILEGTPAATAVAPALKNDKSVRQLSLARISIPAGATTITAQMITDERLDKTVCGIVTEQVSVDTSVMQAQFKGLLEGIQNELLDVEAGTAVELRKKVLTDISVAKTDFATDNTYPDYPFRASVPFTGVVSQMIPQITFSVDALINNNLSPVAECYNGGVYIYAGYMPEDDVHIDTIVCWRGGTSTEGGGESSEAVDELVERLESGKLDDASLHLGFYYDENKDLCHKEVEQ